MLAESVRVFINRYGVTPGRKIVLATSGGSAYQVAADVKTAGIQVTLVDVRAEAVCGPELAELRKRGVEVLTSHTVVGSTGRKGVTGLIVAPVGEAGDVGGRRTPRLRLRRDVRRLDACRMHLFLGNPAAS